MNTQNGLNLTKKNELDIFYFTVHEICWLTSDGDPVGELPIILQREHLLVL